jgi:N-acetylneuraminic acid mutarotase
MRNFATTLAAVSTLWLAACGGGGGGGSSNPPPPPPAPQAQTIAFTTAGPVTRALSEGSYTNAASGGAGTGAITYSSSSAGVATVSNAGTVTFLTTGSTTITATKASSTGFLAATASYTLNISAEAPLSFAAWMGPQETRVTFTGPLAGLEFLRSTQLDCNAANFNTCTGTAASAAGTTPVDSVARLGLEVNWWLRRGASVSPPLRINATQLDGRVRANAVSWRGKLWRVGGAAPPWVADNKVWNSDDGDRWTLVTGITGMPDRSPGTFVVFNDRLWLLGGMGGSVFSGITYNNDVWSSGDGITWRQDVVNAPWSGRTGHSALVFNSRLWVIGGSPNPFVAPVGGDDAWSSADGITWVEETHDGPFAVGARATVLNGRIYTMGGDENSTLRNDVWSSADGRTWRNETNAAPFPTRHSNVFAAVNGRLIVAAGFADLTSYRLRNDVWSSADGITWTEETARAPFSGRADVAAAVHNGRLFLLNGWITDWLGGAIQFRSFYSTEVWSTGDGANWKEHSPHAGGLYPGTYQALAHNGRLWVVGGWDGYPRNDSWSSTDGMTWTRVPLVNGFEPRMGQATTVYNGEFWVSGGGPVSYTNAPSYPLADVWHSADGANWTRATQAAAFSQRGGHSMVVFNNHLLIIGGYADNGTGNYLATSDVFSSTDGATWTPVPQIAPFDPTFNSQALVLNGRLWLLGVPGATSDVWSTADGATWRAEPPSPFHALALQLRSATVHDGRLYITGGGRIVPNDPLPAFENAIYSSADGATWTPVNAGPRYSARAEASMLSFDNKLWVLGGTDANSLKNDVWKSEDGGVTWQMRYVGSIPYP